MVGVTQQVTVSDRRNFMNFKDVKKLIAEKLGWNVTDVFYLCTDKDQFSYYLVYKNHRIRNVIALDELNGCVSGIWD